jgi:hypothetical protein
MTFKLCYVHEFYYEHGVDYLRGKLKANELKYATRAAQIVTRPLRAFDTSAPMNPSERFKFCDQLCNQVNSNLNCILFHFICYESSRTHSHRAVISADKVEDDHI